MTYSDDRFRTEPEEVEANPQVTLELKMSPEDWDQFNADMEYFLDKVFLSGDERLIDSVGRTLKEASSESHL
jgi:hypothetical protein